MRQVFKRLRLTIFDPTPNQSFHFILQANPARHDYSNRDSSFHMETLEIFKIAVKERVFVVPFDFESNSTARSARLLKCPNVVHFVGDRLPRFPVYCLDDGERFFDAIDGGQVPPKPFPSPPPSPPLP